MQKNSGCCTVYALWGGERAVLFNSPGGSGAVLTKRCQAAAVRHKAPLYVTLRSPVMPMTRLLPEASVRSSTSVTGLQCGSDTFRLAAADSRLHKSKKCAFARSSKNNFLGAYFQPKHPEISTGRRLSLPLSFCLALPPKEP